MERVDLREIIVVIGVLTIVTNAATEVLKRIFWREIPTSLLAILIAQCLTLGSGCTYAIIMGTTVLWWHVVAAVIAGRAVAYAAMLSYDKRIEIKKRWAQIKEEKIERQKRQNGEDSGVALYRSPHDNSGMGDGR